MQFSSEYTLTSKKRGYKPFPLALKADSNWEQSKHRMLIVLETVDSKDLKAKQLGASRSKTVLQNVLRYSFKIARRIESEVTRNDWAFALINFNDAQTFTMKIEERQRIESHFANRVQDAIEELEPTHVLILGDNAARHLLPNVEHIGYKRGWVQPLVSGGRKLRCVTSMDLERLYTAKKDDSDDEDGDDDGFGGGMDKDLFGKSNLLGFMAQHIANLVIGYHPYSLKHIFPKPNLVDTIEKFDAMMVELDKAPYFALDTETENLSVLNNKIYLIQLAITEDEGWVLPFLHPDNPWTRDERQYIGSRLRKFFAQRPPAHFKFMLTFNGSFDLTVVRAQFRIPIIFRRVWDIKAGEACLDENAKYFKDVGTKMGNLRGIFTHFYRNDLYYTLPFSKEERNTTGDRKHDDKDVLNYAVLDVQALIGMYKMQLKRASRIYIGDTPYTKGFYKLMLYQMSNVIHVISHMQARGVNIDMLHLTKLKSKQSPLLMLLEEIRAKWVALPNVQAANAKMLGKQGLNSSGGLFNRSSWVLKHSVYEHMTTLFFDVMQLNPVSKTGTGLDSVDKWFQKAYKEEHQEVALYSEIQKLTKLWGTYVKGWYEKLHTDMDSLIDGRMRPQYGFFDVVTGRLNSFKPSLQQVPTRSKEAKYIKRTFVARKRHLQIKFDYSAHEVRVWSIISGDKLLASVFRVGQKLRQAFRLDPTPEKAAQIKTQGDIHIINVKFFFNQDVDKKHPLRDAIKAVVFGVIYGKGPGALSKDIGQKKAYAEDLIKKLFDRFKVGAKWLDDAKAMANKDYYVHSSINRRRNLPGMMTGIDAIIAAMERRAMNAPIQGLSSDIGVTTARLISEAFYEYLEKWFEVKNMKVLPADIEKLVHDACYAEVPYIHTLPFIHIMQYMATYGVTQYYKDYFDMEFTIEPEIEVNINASEDKDNTWDWSDKGLRDTLRTALEDQQKIGLLDGTVDEALDEIYIPYEDKPMRRWLEQNFPILGLDARDSKVVKDERVAEAA